MKPSLRALCRRSRCALGTAMMGMLIAAAHTVAADPLTLSLADCRRLALERNRTIRMSSDEVARARGAVREAIAGYLPDVNMQTQVTAAEAVTRLEFPDPFTGRTRAEAVDLTPNYVIEVTATQPVYTFGRLSNRYEQNRHALEAARHRQAQSADEILYAVEETYYRFLAARDLSAVSAEAVAQAESHARSVRARFENGQASAFDRMRAEVRVQNMKPQEISSRRARETALLGLKRLLGIPLADSVEIAGALEPPSGEITIENAVGAAAEKRPDLAARRDEEAAAGSAVRLARSANFPQLALQGNYSLYAFDLGGDPFSSKTWDDQYQANVVLQWPIFDGFGTKARVSEARAVLAQTRAAREEFEQQVALDVRQAMLALEESRETVRSQESNRDEAAEALQLAQRSYGEGLVSSLDVADAELALSQAKTNYTTALADYYIAEAGLRKAMGTIAE